jgi:hypothetical protein
VRSTSRFRFSPDRRNGIWIVKVFCLRHRVEKSGTGQSRPASLKRLATIPIVWRSASPNRTWRLRQTWMAASEYVSDRPGRPLGLASHSIPRSSQTSNEPRRRSAALSSDPFVTP